MTFQGKKNKSIIDKMPRHICDRACYANMHFLFKQNNLCSKVTDDYVGQIIK